jgi:hypothetical protein
MSKKLEEIAADAAAEWIKSSTTNHSLANACALYGYNAGFLAGYKAANERALRLVDEVQERLSGAYDNGEFMESEWDYIVMAFDTISTAIRGLK